MSRLLAFAMPGPIEMIFCSRSLRLESHSCSFCLGFYRVRGASPLTPRDMRDKPPSERTAAAVYFACRRTSRVRRRRSKASR